MSRYSATETHFALLSIGEKRKTLLESEVTALTSRLSALDLAVSTGSGKSSILPDGFQIADSTDALAEQRSATIAALDTVKADLEDEIRKLAQLRPHGSCPCKATSGEIKACRTNNSSRSTTCSWQHEKEESLSCT
jgi:hypothetical protein